MTLAGADGAFSTGAIAFLPKRAAGDSADERVRAAVRPARDAGGAGRDRACNWITMNDCLASPLSSCRFV